MRFLVVTLAPTLLKDDSQFYSYGPYVKEMNIWFSNVEEVTIVSPTKYNDVLLLSPFLRKDLNVVSIPSILFTGIWKSFISLLSIPVIVLKLFREMHKADHIHLRCPGNIGLIGCLAQIFFPKKPKTAKYAGNWDPKAKQPLSYRFQKWLLGNTFLTKNMQVLVYGEWPNQTKNIKPFFTATYPKGKVPIIESKSYQSLYQFVFVGGLTVGKRPLYAVQLVEELNNLGNNVCLDIYGDGSERGRLEEYIKEKKLSQIVSLHGNQSSERVEEAYRQSDFLILPSKSEGWPKAVAEAMFWGVIPIVTSISCVPWMLGYGERGILINIKTEEDSKLISDSLQNKELLSSMSVKAQKWSHQYTLDDFENEIKIILE